MKIFHDDVRPCPPGWTLARDNATALALLRANEVKAISIDHDLGAKPEDGIDAIGQGEETGRDLARAMGQEGLIPPMCFVHSLNPSGARQIIEELHDWGAGLIIRRPYPLGFEDSREEKGH